eukprot:Lankesteria_metandrocarpae@DN10363_c0_g1_i1.p1
MHPPHAHQGYVASHGYGGYPNMHPMAAGGYHHAPGVSPLDMHRNRHPIPLFAPAGYAYWNHSRPPPPTATGYSADMRNPVPPDMPLGFQRFPAGEPISQFSAPVEEYQRPPVYQEPVSAAPEGVGANNIVEGQSQPRLSKPDDNIDQSPRPVQVNMRGRMQPIGDCGAGACCKSCDCCNDLQCAPYSGDCGAVSQLGKGVPQDDDDLLFPPGLLDDIVAEAAQDAGLSACEHSVTKDELYRNFIRTYDALRDAIDAGQLHRVLHPVLADVIIRKTIDIDAMLAEEEKVDAPDLVSNPQHFRHGAVFVNRIALTSPYAGKIVATYALDVSSRLKISTLLDKLSQLTNTAPSLLRLVHQELPLDASDGTIQDVGIGPGTTVQLYLLPTTPKLPKCPCDGCLAEWRLQLPSIYQATNSVYNVPVTVPQFVHAEFLDRFDQLKLRALHPHLFASCGIRKDCGKDALDRALLLGTEGIAPRVVNMSEIDFKSRQRDLIAAASNPYCCVGGNGCGCQENGFTEKEIGKERNCTN